MNAYALVAQTVLTGALLVIAGVCIAAARANGEGLAGAAVRILATLMLPAIALSFVHALYWELNLAASCALAYLQRPTSSPSRAPLRWTIAALPVALATALVSVKAALALASVPYDGDSMTYHLPMSIAFVQHHTAVPWQVMLHPGNAELLDALGLAALGSIGGQTVTEAIVCMTFFFSAFGVATALGAKPTIACCAASAVLAIPIVGDQLMTSENDVLVATLLLAVLALWRRSPTPSAVALGLLAGTKFTGALEAATLVAVLWTSRSDRFSWKHAAIAVAIAAPWYVRNLIETGNAVFLGQQTSGFASSIAAHLDVALPYLVASFRNYGSLLSLVGFVAVFFVARDERSTESFARFVPIVAGVTLLAWIVTPNSAETSPDTLDQLRSGWSMRYAIFSLALLTTSSILWLSRRSEALGVTVACVAVLSTAIRECTSARHLDAAALVYVVPCLCAGALAFAARFAPARAPTLGFGAAATLAFAFASTSGGSRIDSIWNERYEGSVVLGASAFGTSLADPAVLRANRTATIGRIDALPLVGPRFERFDLVDKSGLSDRAWWEAIREERPQAVVASDVTRSRINSKELRLRASGLYRLTFSDAGVRLYTPLYKN